MLKSFNLVRVGNVKKGSDIVGNRVELNGKTMLINPDFIAYVENYGNGEEFQFYQIITLKDGENFRVKHGSVLPID